MNSGTDNGRILFSIATCLRPIRWYAKIFITEESIEGKLIRSMRFGDPQAVPESSYFPHDPDFLVKNSNLPFMFALSFLTKQQNRFLFFGLGGGTIPIFLRKYFPDCFIDIVEIDQAVLNAAKYMGFQEDDKTHVYIQSYTEFVKNPVTQPYDVLFLDLDILLKVKAQELQYIKYCLTQEGILVINCYMSAKQSRDAIHKTNIINILNYFEYVHTFTPTEQNYGYVCLCKKDSSSASFNIDDNIFKIWELLPNYAHKNDITERIKNTYFESEGKIN